MKTITKTIMLIKLAIKKIIKQIVEIYLSILSLPMVYKSRSKLVLVLILAVVISSIIFNSGLYGYINSDYAYLFVSAAVLNIFFLKFNFIIRIFNVFYKSIIYFYNTYRGDNINKIVPNLSVIIFYYLYNILCFTLTTLLILRLENNLSEYSNTIGEYAYIYSILVAPVLSLMYIDYISEEEIGYNRVVLNKLGKIIQFIIIASITWTTLILLFNFNNPILCDTGNDNQQTNQNTQHNGDTTRNIQNNANNQVTSTNATPRTRTSFTPGNSRSGTNENLQGNINSQTIINNQDPAQPEGNNLINGNKINPRGKRGIKLSSKVILKFDSENFVIRSFQVNKSNLTKSILSVNKTVKKMGPVSELVNLGFMNNNSYIKTSSFFDVHLMLSDYLKYGGNN
uniref:hypothetical protein n=1 Tax=Porodaedalea mongolica TaxID=2651638 RepID=UPI0021AC8672|nr:hypothetical protein NYK79_mgp18 [Porodaedalea mongolica]UUA03972.1 hypothetical protein [Porodaedalea mongolica]WCF76739.1 hypothetical protein [Porodaedalea mongolica]